MALYIPYKRNTPSIFETCDNNLNYETKQPNERSSFRPISPMGCGIKILCKALARRLELYLSHIVGNDQMAMPKWIWILWYLACSEHIVWKIQLFLHTDTAVVSLDVRQALTGMSGVSFLMCSTVWNWCKFSEMDKALIHKPNCQKYRPIIMSLSHLLSTDQLDNGVRYLCWLLSTWLWP